MAEPQRHRSITLLQNIPAPYRVPVFNELSRLTAGRLKVLFTTTSWPHRPWTLPVDAMKFDWRFLAPGGRVCRAKGFAVVAAMLGFLLRTRPAVVVSGGYDTPEAWLSFLWCKLFRRRFVLWVESNVRDHRRPGVIKDWLKRLMVKEADAVGVPGRASLGYVRHLGAADDQVFLIPNGFDIEFFAREARAVDAAREKQLRGYPAMLILYAGRLVRMKGVFVLLQAFQRISAQVPNVGLLVVGHGPEQQAMEDFCAHLPRVYFEGPQPYHRMPYYYALADVLALPTLSDTWGLVVNEAFACGLPAVVSRVAGVCDELILEGETGFAVEPNDADDLRDKIVALLRDSSLRSRMGRNCRRLVQKYSAEACADGLLAASLNGESGCIQRRAPESY